MTEREKNVQGTSIEDDLPHDFTVRVRIPRARVNEELLDSLREKIAPIMDVLDGHVDCDGWFDGDWEIEYGFNPAETSSPRARLAATKIHEFLPAGLEVEIGEWQ